MQLSEFWNSTRGETLMFIQAFRWRMEEQSRNALIQAWHTAALAGANFSKNGIPKLESILPRRREPERPMTIAEEVRYWEAFAARHSAPTRPS